MTPSERQLEKISTAKSQGENASKILVQAR